MPPTEAVAAQTTPPTLTALLALKESPENSKVEYVIGGLELTGTDREYTAQLLADDAMRIRCGNSPVLAGGAPAVMAARKRPERVRRPSRPTPSLDLGCATNQPTTTTCRVLWPSCCGTG